jgi:hypothetical protein
MRPKADDHSAWPFNWDESWISHRVTLCRAKGGKPPTIPRLPVCYLLRHPLRSGTLHHSHGLQSERVRPLLINTKLRVPASANAALPRPELMQQIDRVADRKLAIVSAPTGFGKSTLLTQWALARRCAGQ